MKGCASPFNVVFLMRIKATKATTTPRIYIPNVIKSAFPIPAISTIAPAIAVNIGNLAPQEKKGITLTVAILSFSSF